MARRTSDEYSSGLVVAPPPSARADKPRNLENSGPSWLFRVEPLTLRIKLGVPDITQAPKQSGKSFMKIRSLKNLQDPQVWRRERFQVGEEESSGPIR